MVGSVSDRGWLYLPRTASFNPPIAFSTLPAALSALPSVSSFLSPKAFPAASFTAPLICFAEPLSSILIHCRNPSYFAWFKLCLVHANCIAMVFVPYSVGVAR